MPRSARVGARHGVATPLTVRNARPGDAAALAVLVADLGTDAHAAYLALGFEDAPLRFTRRL